MLQPRVVAVPWSRVCFPLCSPFPSPTVAVARYCCAWEPQYHHCLLWANRMDGNETHWHVQDLSWTPKGIWARGDISADGKSLGYWTGTTWARLEQEPDKAAGGIRQSWLQVQPGQVQKAGVWYKSRGSQLYSGCPSAVVPLSSVTLMLNTEKKWDEEQLCKGSSFFRCRCLIWYKWGLTEVQHCQGVHH